MESLYLLMVSIVNVADYRRNYSFSDESCEKKYVLVLADLRTNLKTSKALSSRTELIQFTRCVINNPF